jgi:hypothetical protein
MKKSHSNLDILIQLKHDADCKAHPLVPKEYVPRRKYTDKTANGLTKAIVDFLNLSGHQAERINTTGRYVDGSKTYTDTLGHTRKIGSGKWIKGTTTRGSADISSIIKGYSVKIEVKIGNDRQSDHQKEYEEAVKNAGGQYWIAKDFDTFIFYYETFLNYLCKK